MSSERGGRKIGAVLVSLLAISVAAALVLPSGSKLEQRRVPAGHFSPGPGPGFEVDAPENASVVRGSSCRILIDVDNTGGYDNWVALSDNWALNVGGKPTGVTVTFSPENSTPRYQSYMTVSAADNTPTGVYTVIVEGLGGDGEKNDDNFRLTIMDFAISLDPDKPRISRGLSENVDVTVENIWGYSELVVLENQPEDLPEGVLISFESDNKAPTFSTTMTLSVAENTPTGEHLITIKGRGADNRENAVTCSLTVMDFYLTLSRTSDVVEQGGAGFTAVRVSPLAGYNYSVDLSASGQPSGVYVIFDRMGVPEITSGMSVLVEDEAEVGDYALTIRAAGGDGRVHTAVLSLKVIYPPAATIDEIPAGGQWEGNVRKGPLERLAIEVQTKVENVVITLLEPEEEPSEVSELDTPVYSYFIFEAENISEEDISNLTIGFRVRRSWVQQNNINPSKVGLNRYSAGGWQQLVTRKIDEDAVYIYYSAESPDFSTFAITGEEKRPSLLDRLTDWRVLTAIGVVVAIVVLVVWKKRAPPEEGWKARAAEEERPPGEKPPEKEEKPSEKEEDIWW